MNIYNWILAAAPPPLPQSDEYHSVLIGALLVFLCPDPSQRSVKDCVHLMFVGVRL